MARATCLGTEAARVTRERRGGSSWYDVSNAAGVFARVEIRRVRDGGRWMFDVVEHRHGTTQHRGTRSDRFLAEIRADEVAQEIARC